MSGTGYKQFMRWLYKWEPIVINDGSFDSTLRYQTNGLYELTQDYLNQENNSENLPLIWKELGPILCPNNTNMDPSYYKRIKGPGRCSFVEFDRLNNQRVFTGSPSGGLFYSTNGGDNWKNGGTDRLPNPGISHFQLDAPSNTWFIATGDADCGFTSSYGIFRSTNEGINWNSISAGLGIPNLTIDWWEKQCRKILINPINGNIMYAVFFDGIYKTENALTTIPEEVLWNKVCEGKFTDIQFKPNSNYQQLYASGSSIYFSTNAGNNWSIIPNISQLNIAPSDLITIRVTAANPNILYAAVVCEPSTTLLYKYNALTQTWSYVGPMTHTIFEYLPYGMGKSRAQSFTVSPNDENLMFRTHVQYIYKSTNGGINWLPVSDNKHDDSHWLTFSNDGSALWIATDGGVNKSTDFGTNWENKTNNIGVSNMHNIACGNTLYNQILYGGFDTGTSLFDETTWSQMGGPIWNGFGDSFDCLIDDTDPQNPIYYFTTQYDLWRSTNGGVDFIDMTVPSTIGFHNWEHRLVKDFHTQSTLYYPGTNRIGRSLDKAVNWSAISFDAKEGEHPNRMFHALWNSSNYPNYLYALRINPVWQENDLDAFRLFKSSNCNESNPSNVSWTDVTPVINGQTIHKWISDVSIDEEYPDKIWVCYSGFYNDQKPKVMYFNGSTWEDMTGGNTPDSPLYGISTYKIILQRNSDIVYLATSAGLYYRTNNTNWISLPGVPHCNVWDMDINYYGNKLRIATFGRGLWETDLPCIYTTIPSEISDNQVWNNEKRLSSDVIVKNNSTLTITSRISLPTSAKIIIEPGSKLIIDGGILTNACNGSLWGGIDVQGNPMSLLLPAYQGYVELKSGAIIENAETGIHCILNQYQPNEDGPVCYASGGIINADSSFFKNNLISVEIEPYISGTSYNSTIKNSTFEYTDTISSELELIYIKLTDVKDVNIFTNKFEGNTANAYNNRGIGIAAHDATFDLNEAEPPTSNDFNNMTYGIACYNTNGNTSPDISVTNFTDCWRSIYLSGVSNANVLVNTISYKSQTSTAGMQAYGIYLDNCTGYHVEGNVLSASNTTAKPEYGIIINNSGANNDKIYRNKFTNIKYPVNAQNANRSTTGNTGLQILCNNCIDAVINDILVTSQTDGTTKGIRLNQGYFTGNPNTSIPAGNLFTYNENISYKNYINSSPNLFNYARYAQTGVISYQNISHYVTPKIYSINAKINLQNTQIEWSSTRWEGTDCKDSTGLSGGGKSLNGMEGYKEQIGVLQGKIDIANNLLMQKMDNGNTTSLINRINSCGISGYGKLYSDLRKYSPYLSEEVLLALIHKQGFQTNLLVNLMLVNTPVAKTYWLMDALREVQPPLTFVQLEQIQSKDQVYSEMEIERMQLSNLIAQRDNLYNGIESFYSHDSLPQSNDSLCMMLQRDPRLTAKYELVYHYFAKNDSVNADQLLNEIPQLYALDANEQSEYSKYKQLYEMKRQLQREGKDLDKLNEQQKHILIDAINVPSLSLSEMNDLNALRQADNLVTGKMGQTRGKGLTLNYMEPILEPIENKGLISDNSKETKSDELLMEGLIDQVLMGENTLLLYPNPTVDEVNILYNVAGETNNVSIEISDLTGRAIGKYTVDKKENHLKINTQSFKKGIYYVILVVDGKNQKIDKLVVQ